MVVRFAPNVTQFKPKRSYRSDYFGPEPDKAVPKAVPKVVFWKAIPLYLLVLLSFWEDFWCPEEDVLLPGLLFFCKELGSVQNSGVVPKAVPIVGLEMPLSKRKRVQP